MTWRSLGTLTLTDQWQSFPMPLVNCETFRAIHPSGLRYEGKVLLAPFFAGEGRGRAQRVYPSDTPRILTFPLPSDFLERGSIVFYMQARLSRYARADVGQSWTLELQEFV